ncbi:MAG TPA: hypothetical protein VFA11_19795 [Acidimicrobiales bacterium]|nr:hypothetical protein [Acidimicrobiales bacterium]
MVKFIWPSEDGWPYPDVDDDVVDPDWSEDDDLMSLRVTPAGLMSGLDSDERDVITARFGLDGRPPRSLKQIEAATGMAPGDLRHLMGSGLAKLRTQLR